MKKKEFVHSMFSSIAPQYDRANSLLTFGLDSYWRKKLVQLSHVKKDAKILDCATGTGKLVFDFAKKLDSLTGEIYGIDFCQSMLDQIDIKSLKNSQPKIVFQKADILNLPFPDSYFDVTSIAYGLRNLSDLEKGLKEMARVTKPQGIVMVLETGQPTSFIVNPFLSFYMKTLVPLLGGWITGNKNAYKYLNETSLNFPSKDKLINIFEKTNCYQNIQCYPLFCGASYIYKANIKKSRPLNNKL